MTDIDIAHGLIFKELNIQNEDFDSRLLCQKKIFLLQELGTSLGYYYNWYIHGPYSPALTNYLYSNLGVLTDYDYSQYRLQTKSKDNIAKIHDLENECPHSWSLTDWFELLASMIYLFKKRSFNIETIKIELPKLKPQFPPEKIEEAIPVLNKCGLINAH